MPSPFPGMDPFLEAPSLWPDVHNALIAELRRTLGPILRPRSLVCLEERTCLDGPEERLLVGRPDLAVQGGASRISEPSSEPPCASTAGSVVAVEVPVPDRVRETWLEVRTVVDGEAVTVLEILSPSNKRPGEGRRTYEEKRKTVLGSRTSRRSTSWRPCTPSTTRPPATSAMDHGGDSAPPLAEADRPFAEELLRSKGLRS